MQTLATEVRWTSKSPKICFDFFYDKKRNGSTQSYQLKVSCRPLYNDNSKFGYPIIVQIWLDDVERTTFTLKAANPSTWSSEISETTDWMEITNKTAGTTGLKIRIYSSSGSSRDQSYEYVLPLDPAASTISSTTATIGYDAVVTVRRYADSHTHTIAYNVGNESGYIDANGNFSDSPINISATTLSINIPKRFYEHIPDSQEGVVNLTCSTYAEGVLLGTSEGNIKFIVDYAECRANIAGTVMDINPKTLELTGNKNVLICFRSTAQCRIMAEAKCSATITDRFINGEEVDRETETKIFEQVGTGNFLFTATDSRGIVAEVEEHKTLIPYIRLTSNASIKRTDPVSGNAQLTLKGNCFCGSFGAAENTLKVTCKRGDLTIAEMTPQISPAGKYEMAVLVDGFDYMETHTVTVIVEDKLDKVVSDLTVQPGIPVFDWGQKDFCFHVPVGFDASVSGAYIRTVNLNGSRTFTVQSKFLEFDPNTNLRQSLFLFGWDELALVSGVAGLRSNGTAAWSGTDGISIEAAGNGQFVITLEEQAYDWFTLISAEPIQIV